MTVAVSYCDSSNIVFAGSGAAQGLLSASSLILTVTEASAN